MDNPLPLRDIHLPDPVSWFPPAIGWWIALLLAVLLIYLLWWMLRQLNKPVLNKTAVNEIDAVIDNYQQHGDTLLFMQQLSATLKRIGMSYFPRDEVAGLSGAGWVERLNSLVKKNRLTATQVELLATAPYQKSPALADDQTQALIEQIRRWAGALPRLKKDTGNV